MEKSGKQTYNILSGRYYHLLDNKGRVSVPVMFRKSYNAQVVLSRGLDGCLFLFDQSRWDQIAQDLNGSLFAKKLHRDFSRLMLHSAVVVDLDQLGRILIPEDLRALAHLTKEVVFAGSGDRVEIWDRGTYHAYLEAIETRAEHIAEEYADARLAQKGDHAN